MVEGRVRPGLAGRELDEAPLGDGDRETLRAGASRRALRRVASLRRQARDVAAPADPVRTLVPHGVELGSDHVEGQVEVRPGGDDPDAHSLPRPGLERSVNVLERVSVERDGAGRGAADRVGVGALLEVRRPVLLGLDEVVFAVHAVEAGRIDDHSAVHAVGDMGGQRLGAAVVQPDAAAPGGEGVGERLPRSDGAHRLVG